MRKFLFSMGLLVMLFCGGKAQLSAQPCDPNWSNCEEWSLCDGRFTVCADWLYWKATESHVDFGIVANIDSMNHNHSHIHVLRPNPKYESGYRVGLGYELPCDCWDLSVVYTNLPSHAKRHFSVNLPEGDVILLNNEAFAHVEADLDNPLAAVKAKWDLNVSYLDIDFARTVCFGECFSIRPHAGARIYWMDQKFLLSGNFIPDSELAAQAFHARLKERFNGYGIEGGLWAHWKVGCGLSVVGHVGGSVLYSNFRPKARLSENLNSALSEGSGSSSHSANSNVISALHFKDDFWTGTPTFDYFIGLQYDTCFCETQVAARIGWEQHILFDARALARGSNLSLQGLTLGMAVSF